MLLYIMKHIFKPAARLYEDRGAKTIDFDSENKFVI
jgi:hypothetical protein